MRLSLSILVLTAHLGSTAAVVGSAAAWDGTDEVFAQYRGAQNLSRC